MERNERSLRTLNLSLVRISPCTAVPWLTGRKQNLRVARSGVRRRRRGGGTWAASEVRQRRGCPGERRWPRANERAGGTINLWQVVFLVLGLGVSFSRR